MVSLKMKFLEQRGGHSSFRPPTHRTLSRQRPHARISVWVINGALHTGPLPIAGAYPREDRGGRQPPMNVIHTVGSHPVLVGSSVSKSSSLAIVSQLFSLPSSSWTYVTPSPCTKSSAASSEGVHSAAACTLKTSAPSDLAAWMAAASSARHVESTGACGESAKQCS